MTESFFSVTCPSCETSFEVTDASLIGQIVACPKCGGMILVAEPDERDKTSVVEGESVPIELEETGLDEEAGVLPVSHDSNGTAPSDSPDAASVAVDFDKEDVRTSRALAITCGVFCAVILTSIVSFVFFYIKTPQTGESQVDSTPRQIQTSDESTTEHVDDFSSEETSSREIENEEVPGVGDEFQSDTNLTDTVETYDAFDEKTSDFTGENNDTSDVEEGGDELEIDSPSLLPEAEQVVNDFGAEPDDVDSTTDEESEEVALDDDNGLSAEFNEAEFAKANQRGAEETDGGEEEDLGSVALTVDVNAQAPLPSMTTHARDLDVSQRLKLPLKAIEFPDSPVASTRLLSEFMGVPIEFNLDQIVLLRGSFNRKLDLKLESVDVETALAKLAEMLKWKVEPQTDRVVIESLDASGSAVEEQFDVADLLTLNAPIRVRLGDETPFVQESLTNEKLCDYLNSFLDATRNGDGAEVEPLRCEGTKLIALRDATARKRVEILLAQLRAINRLTNATMVPEAIVPETLGWQTLEQKTNFNLFRPTSLQHAIGILEAKFHLMIIWDDATLNANGISRDSTTLARIDSESLDQVFFDLLEPLRLTYVVLDEKTFLITSHERANRYLTVEIHNFADSNAALSEKEIRRLTEQLQRDVAPESWNERECALWLDLDSKCWIVRQSQPIQREIRRWTKGRFRKNKTKPGEPQSSEAEETRDAVEEGENDAQDEADFNQDLPERTATPDEE